MATSVTLIPMSVILNQGVLHSAILVRKASAGPQTRGASLTLAGTPHQPL